MFLSSSVDFDTEASAAAMLSKSTWTENVSCLNGQTQTCFMERLQTCFMETQRSSRAEVVPANPMVRAVPDEICALV